MQQFQPFGFHRAGKQAHTSDIAARSIDAGYQAGFDRIAAIHEDNRYRRSGRFPPSTRSRLTF
jgi:hypothetical protein